MEIKTPATILSNITTRGDFQRVIERAGTERRETDSLPPEHPIWEAWLLMREQFGAQWTHGDEPSMGWVYALRNMTDAQLKNGIDNLAHRDDSRWPPNAQEFRDLCLTNFDWERKCHKVLRTDNMIEDLTIKEAHRKERIEQMKKLKAESGLFK